MEDPHRTSVEEIREFVRENWRHFGPRGLGWRSPSAAIQAYAADLTLWADDLYGIDALRSDEWNAIEQSTLDAARAARAESVKGIAPETKALIDQVRELAAEGLEPDIIAVRLGVNPAGVRNVLRLGNRAYSPGEGGGLERSPAIDAYIQAMKSF